MSVTQWLHSGWFLAYAAAIPVAAIVGEALDRLGYFDRYKNEDDQ